MKAGKNLTNEKETPEVLVPVLAGFLATEAKQKD
jgi:hypothetical protein